MLPHDSLCLLTLSTKEKAYIPGVQSFQLFMQNDTEWLACQLNNTGKELLLYNLATGAKTAYKNVDSYIRGKDGQTLILQSTADSAQNISLQWLHLPTRHLKEIWKGHHINHIHLDEADRQLAFLAQDNHTAHPAIWLYKPGEGKAISLVNNHSPTIPENLELSAIEGFSKDGSKLFLQLKSKPLPKRTPGIVPVNIWSYRDAKLQSQQLHELSLGTPTYLAVMDTKAPFHIQRIQQAHEKIDDRTGDAVLLTYREGEASERYWNKVAKGVTYLVNLNNGQRWSVPLSRASISPGGKYIMGYGAAEIWGSDLHIYETGTGITRNITANIPVPQQDAESDMLLTKGSCGLSGAAWLPEDTALLVYDNYDIWQVDPSGKKTPINLTNGRNEQWQLRLATEHILGKNVVQPGEPLLLKGFNKASKESGYYQFTFSTKVLTLLSKGNYVFGKFPTPYGQSYFLKARDAEVYLVKREQATQSPNLFATTDFRSFTPVSQVYPEKAVNWLTSELVHFKTLDGISAQAILYKPENFDTLKKYPLIIHYYEKKSDELHQYRHPIADNGGELDIAWFVSHGYLVLLSDIHYKTGEPGASAYRSVIGAVQYMTKLPYVDKDHIGIQGHSFGGYETNYLVTHSHLFAAAVSSSGVCDVTSDFGNVWPNDMARQEYWEMRNGRMGTTPWEAPDRYMENSPIFYVGQISTPLLLLHNRNDKNVHFEQGLEFFLGLRRASKRAWMLEYDNGGHGVWGKEYQDYLLRMTQFFDHYLKGAPAPKWITQGIPADRKGMETGFELDDNTRTPGEGLLIKQEKAELPQ